MELENRNIKEATWLVARRVCKNRSASVEYHGLRLNGLGTVPTVLCDPDRNNDDTEHVAGGRLPGYGIFHHNSYTGRI